ncbi:MAG TPA: hypothetical protein VK072_01440 [Candidatus Avamphibacillus sp.]|nr:hypothetical protein [Candidatus Avamphibacillus sp.]
MVLVSLIILIGMIVLFVEEKNKMITVYKTGEDGITDSHEIFWLLKNNKLHPVYSAPINWQATFWFGRGQNNVQIFVHKKNEERARELMMHYRAEQRRINKNIEKEREKSRELFLGN